MTLRMYAGLGRMVGVADLLDLVPENDWVWSIPDVDGTGPS
ncbi:hypothetical protein ACGILS_01025 [Streptomyces albidoflavus]|nr:hypothetical protein [Streptomyces albidoflavus]MCU7705366.1 hypothetical protein [Streptomyces albidoflavus]